MRERLGPPTLPRLRHRASAVALASAALLWGSCRLDFDQFKECTSDPECRSGEVCEERVCHLDWEWPHWPVSGESPPDGGLVVDTDAGTVADQNTQLLWRIDYSPDAGGYWESANGYCAAIATDGEAWRLPTRIELLSLVDPTRDYSINGEVFAPSGDWYWTSSPRASDPNYKWVINFYSGSATVHNKAKDKPEDKPGRARCVRRLRTRADPNSAPRYSVEGTSVTDTSTGLTWQQAVSDQDLAWEAAKSYCSAGWQLPTKRELETLVDVRAAPPTIDQKYFPETPQAGFWTSTIVHPTPEKAFQVDFKDGLSLPTLLADGRGRVRCVRR